MSMKSATRGRLKSVALLAGGVLAGAVLVGATAANAATSTPSPSASSSASSGGSSATLAPPQGRPGGPMGHGGPTGPGGATPVRSDEKSVSSDVAAKLKAEALAQVPGATVIRVETDAGDAAYEVHLTKSDGTLATVKFDKNLAFVKVESGMGLGDPRPQGAPQGAPQGTGTAPAVPSPSGSTA